MPRPEQHHPCQQNLPSGRHRWIEVAGKHPAHRECKHCNAVARVSNNGQTIFVSKKRAA